jgi:hypothetical protein
MLRKFASLSILVPLLAFGCSLADSNGDGHSDTSSSDDGSVALGGGGAGGSEGVFPLAATKKIGKDGGTIEVRSAKLRVPAGALTETMSITVDILPGNDAAKLPPLPPGVDVTSDAARFRPHGLTFETPVDVEMAVKKKTATQKAVKLANESDETWEVATKVKVSDAKLAAFKTKSFSIYLIVDDPDGILPDSGEIDPNLGSGGASGSGGATGGGGTGGTGTGGAVNLPNGYFDNGVWHGFGNLTLAGLTSGSSDLNAKPAPNCFSGKTDVDIAGYAELSYHLNESPAKPGTIQAMAPAHDGLLIDTTGTSSRLFRVVLRSSSDSWCAYLPGEGSQFLPYASFQQDCAGEKGEYYAGQALDSVGLNVASTGEAGIDYGACFNSFSDATTPPNGYMQSAHFQGYTNASTSGATVVSTDNDSKSSPPYCVTGYVGATPGDMALLAANLSQSRVGETPLAIVPTGNSLLVESSFSGNLASYVVIGDGTNSWCALSLGGSEAIPWDEFTVNCDGSGGTYALEPIVYAFLYAPSVGVQEDIGMCLSSFDSTTLDHAGYWTSGSFAGYGRLEATSGASAVSTLTRHDTGPYCTHGTVPAAASASESAAMLFTVAETTDHTVSAFPKDGDGLSFNYSGIAAPYYGVIVDDVGQHYCAEISNGVPVTYDMFTSDCGAGGGTAYTGSPIVSVGITVLADSSVPIDYDYCLDSVDIYRILPD